MASMWIPTWLDVAWMSAFGAALLVHVRHVAVLTGYSRLWHGIHVLMAAGMIVMFSPGGMAIVPAGLGVFVFAAAATTLGVLLLARSGRRHAPLWMIAIVDLAAMAYMFTMMSAGTVWLTIPLVAWFGAQSIGWATGRLTVLGRALESNSHRDRSESASRPIATTTSQPPLAAALPATSTSHPHVVAHNLVDRVALAIMGAGMAYMLITMQAGHGA